MRRLHALGTLRGLGGLPIMLATLRWNSEATTHSKRTPLAKFYSSSFRHSSNDPQITFSGNLAWVEETLRSVTETPRAITQTRGYQPVVQVRQQAIARVQDANCTNHTGWPVNSRPPHQHQPHHTLFTSHALHIRTPVCMRVFALLCISFFHATSSSHIGPDICWRTGLEFKLQR